jgi:hypothetical protein
MAGIFDVYDFDPAPDMTAYELAQIVRMKPAMRWANGDDVAKLPKEVQRHFNKHETTETKR